VKASLSNICMYAAPALSLPRFTFTYIELESGEGWIEVRA
jgi:hypothetical protein